jgi:hypothetical protein
LFAKVAISKQSRLFCLMTFQNFEKSVFCFEKKTTHRDWNSPRTSFQKLFLNMQS